MNYLCFYYDSRQQKRIKNKLKKPCHERSTKLIQQGKRVNTGKYIIKGKL